jgi:hypothetical protein
LFLKENKFENYEKPESIASKQEGSTKNANNTEDLIEGNKNNFNDKDVQEVQVETEKSNFKNDKDYLKLVEVNKIEHLSKNENSAPQGPTSLYISNSKKISQNNLSIKNLSKNFTLRDYKDMNYEDFIKYDNRTFGEYYRDRLFILHSFFKAFFYKSLIIPQSIRIIAFFLLISFSFALNAIFYTDKFIQDRTKSYEQNTQNNFLYTISNQFWKSVWSVIIGTIPIILLNFLLIIPNEVYEKFNNGLLTVDLDKIELAVMRLNESMRIKHYLYIFIAFILHMFSWYYVTAFCGVYTMSSVSWVCGGILSIIINLFFVQILIPLVHVGFRTLAKTYPENKLGRILYKICLKIF